MTKIVDTPNESASGTAKACQARRFEYVYSLSLFNIQQPMTVGAELTNVTCELYRR